MFCEEDQDERPKGEDDVHQGELQGGREEVNQGDCRDPNNPGGDEHGNGSLKIGFSAEGVPTGGKGALLFGKEVPEDGLGQGQEGAPDELVDESLFDNGGRVGAIAKDMSLETIKEIDFPPLNGPRKGEEHDLFA